MVAPPPTPPPPTPYNIYCVYSELLNLKHDHSQNSVKNSQEEPVTFISCYLSDPLQSPIYIFLVLSHRTQAHVCCNTKDKSTIVLA